MDKLSIKEVISYKFEDNRYYTLNDIIKIFSQYYNIDVEEFKLVGYSYKEVIDIVNNNHHIKMNSNGDFIFSKYGIWELFLNLFSKIELNDEKIEISSKIYERWFNRNANTIVKIFEPRKKGSKLLLDDLIIEKVLLKMFPKELDYNYSYRKEIILNILEKYGLDYEEKDNKFILDMENLPKFLKELMSNIELTITRYYSINDIQKRLQYPANLNNYYIDSPLIYYCEEKWIDYSKSRIQEIIMEDYDGIVEFYKGKNWKIYGPDERFKNELGKWSIPIECSSEIRPEGYSINKGKLQYLMNSTYCKYLILELERRILRVNYKYSLSELEGAISKLSKVKILDYSSKILVDINKYYIENIESILDSNKERIKECRHVIEEIQKYRKQNTLRALEVYKELKTAVNKLERIKYSIPTEDILTNINDILKKDKKNNSINIARKLYKKQIRNDENFEKFRLKSYSLQGECSRIVEEIKENLLEFRKSLKQKKLIQFDLYFKDILDI